MNDKPRHPQRRIFFSLLLISTLVCIPLYGSISKKAGDNLSKSQQLGDTTFANITDKQFQIIVGAHNYILDHAEPEGLSPSSSFASGLYSTLQQRSSQLVDEAIKSSSGSTSESKLSPKIDRQPVYLLKVLLLADYLKLDEQAQQLAENLSLNESFDTSDQELIAMVLLTRAQKEIDDSLREKLISGLGWSANLLLATKDGVSGTHYRRIVSQTSSDFLKKFAVICIVGVGFVASCLLAFLSLSMLGLFYGLTTRFSVRPEMAPPLFEIFSLYLAAMFFGSLLIEPVVRYQGLGAFPLAALAGILVGISVFALLVISRGRTYRLALLLAFSCSVVVVCLLTGFDASHLPFSLPLTLSSLTICATLVTLLWPVLDGISIGNIKSSLGIVPLGLLASIKECFIGLIAYLAAWPVLLVAMTITAILATLFDMDINQGAHPIVPFLASGVDRWSILLIFLLASVAAPVVEEIMFRGAFYGWLRKYLSPHPAQLISGLIFASIHPQGILGIIPLATIGFTLAWVREWRGNLIAPIVTHACVNSGTLILVILMSR